MSEQKLIIGCNYHTTWQRDKTMRFILAEIKGTRARLETRQSCKNFWTDIKDLIFIESPHNRRKGGLLTKSYISIQEWSNN